MNLKKNNSFLLWQSSIIMFSKSVLVVGKTVNLHKFCLYWLTCGAFQRQTWRILYMHSVWLFVCFWLYVSDKNFSLIWRIHHNWLGPSYLDLYSALMTIEQWRFFSMPHLLLHRSSIYNGHLRGPLALTPVVERWQWSCHCIYEFGLSWLRFEFIVSDFDFRHNKQYIWI